MINKVLAGQASSGTQTRRASACVAFAVLIKSSEQPLYRFASFCTETIQCLHLQALKRQQKDLNLSVSDLCNQGFLKEAVDVLHKEDPAARVATLDTYTTLLVCCSRVRSLPQAKRVHSHISRSGMQHELSHRVITTFSKCGSLQDAEGAFKAQSDKSRLDWNAVLYAHAELGTFEDTMRAFNIVPEASVTTWNAILTACARHGKFTEALGLFNEMLLKQHFAPTKDTFTSLFKSFVKPKALKGGMEIHALVIKFGLASPEIAWVVINMYAKCRKIEDAQWVFDMTPSRNALCWAGIITGCANTGRYKAAVDYFLQMLQQGLEPTLAIYIKILEVCANRALLILGSVIHAQLVETSQEHVLPAANVLILMYGKCMCFQEARSVFDTMEERDLYSWTHVMKTTLESGTPEETQRLFKEMQKQGNKPNAFTLSTVIDSLSSQSDPHLINSMESLVTAYGYESNLVITTALICMYGRCKNLSKAQELFNGFERKDRQLWTIMIGLYARCGKGSEALDLFDRMDNDGVMPDPITYVNVLSACAASAMLERGESICTRIKEKGLESNSVVRTALMNMYVGCERTDLARRLFDEMTDRDVVAWTTLIGAYTQSDCCDEVFQLFGEMLKEGVEPNRITYATVLDYFANISALVYGKIIHVTIVSTAHDADTSVGASLINLYANCGSIDDMQRVFDIMTGYTLDTWNLIIAALVEHDYNREAIERFEQMQERSAFVQPNKVTFTHVLSACQKLNLVNEGRRFFDLMRSKYKITPVGEHLASMVGLLGKAGWLKEAEACISKMQSPPSAYVWKTLLEACKLHNDVERGVRAARALQDMGEFDSETQDILATLRSGKPLEKDFDEGNDSSC